MTPTDVSHPRRALVARLVLLLFVVGASGALLAGLFLPTAFAVTDVVDSVRTEVLSVPPLPEEFEVPPERSIVLAADGSELAEIYFEENRVSVSLDDVPALVRNAVIATEDLGFYEHNGINHTAIVRAAIANVRAGEVEQGGSTITQQYIKTAAGLATDKSLDRKIKEAVWAVELERRLSKDEILERYLNRTYFGSGVYGIGTAAEYYFSRPLGELSVEQAAMLAGLIRSPERNNPLKNEANALERRNVVLDQMATAGFITADEAEAATARPLELKINELATPETPFWIDWVTRLLINEPTAQGLGSQMNALRAVGETPDERIATVFQGGIRIHTTIDPEFQLHAEEALAEFLNDPLRDPMGAIVSVEPGTGAIRTMAVGPKTHGDCGEPVEVDETGRELCDKTKFNPAVPADAGSGRRGRQPGSSFKPYVIAAALEAGYPPGWQIEATGPQTITDPTCSTNNKPWTVNNSGGNGVRDMYSGIAGSSNVFHARLISEVGPAKVKEVATRLGIRSTELKEVCAMALGSEEVFPVEHAAAFATFANRGVYCPPFAISRIEDRTGKLLFEHTPDCERVIDEGIADRVVDIMKGPVQSGGTAPVANLGKWDTRGKTGTTDDNVDAWFVGYVKQLATAAWIGYENGVDRYATAEQAAAACPHQHDGGGGDDLEGNVCIVTRYLRNVTIGGQAYSRVFGGTIPAPMWKAYMERAVERFEPVGFPRPGPLPGATVPDLSAFIDRSIDETRGEMQKIVEGARLNFEVATIEHYAAPGTVVGQDPPPGTGVLAGRAIFVHVSNGEGQAPLVPDVVGMSQKKATAVLEGAGYEVRVLEREVDDEDQNGVVVDQNPKPGRELVPGDGAQVAILVGKYEEPEPEPSPTETPSPDATESPKGGGGGGGGNSSGDDEEG
ncbi:MAG: transglycosylase domain-containing protein [Actinobacteria bacterium]|nr:transglycosylase domain-containing protein [Actinomycetota bacterium]